MADPNLRSALCNKDKQVCHRMISSNVVGESLVVFLYELLYASALVSYDKKLALHPICVINSIKNLIGDDRENPSTELLKFAIDYLFQFEFRNNDQDKLDEVIRDGIGETVFVGELEDACQVGDWKKAEIIMSKTFIASDRSRATFDTLAELALQNAPKNALFIYHILRGYQFQEIKKDTWTFIKCIFNQMNINRLDSAHEPVAIAPDDIKQRIIETGDVIYFSAIERIWHGEYVRIRGYRRELSYWLSEIRFDESEIMKMINDHFLIDLNKRSYINFSEKIINKERTKNNKAEDLVTLEAIRALCKNIDKNGLTHIGSRFNQLT